MRWDAYVRVVGTIGPKLDEDHTFQTWAFVRNVRAGALAVIERYEFDAEEAAVVLEMASRVSPFWYEHRRRARRRERERSKLSA